MQPKPVDPANTDNPPSCKADCPYRQTFKGYDLQKNALRTETASLVQAERCGWNIKPGKLGGRPLDYEACIYTGR